MNSLKKLFQQTFIYGLATVLPRVLSVVLVRLYTQVFEEAAGYGEYTTIYAWIAIFNVFLSYGMETAFFRFYQQDYNKGQVVSTSLTSLLFSSLGFLFLGFLFAAPLSAFTGIRAGFISYTLLILVLDALVVVPFAILRAHQKPKQYAIIKFCNVLINLCLNLFFLLLLPKWATQGEFWASLYLPNFAIQYIFIANLIASAFTLLYFLPVYFKTPLGINKAIWVSMITYAYPVMIAGLAFTVNEVFDKILLDQMVGKEQSGIYAACYKLALFMTLYGTAFRLGVEPFFFSYAKNEDAPKTYATITKFFIILGSFIVLTVMVFVKPLGSLLLRNEVYWTGIEVVPLILMASFFLGIYHNFSVWYKITNRTQFGAIISSVGALVTLAVNFAFIPKYGYWASAWATFMAYMTMMLLSYYFGRKYYPIPYNLRKAAFYSLTALIFGLISFYALDQNIIWGVPLWLLYGLIIYRLEGNYIKQIFFKRED